MPRSRDRVPFPEKLPGEFFVVTRDRFSEKYTLLIDDEDHSSFDLGSDVQEIMMRFRLWGEADLGYRVVDMAKEFGAAQAIIGKNRVIALYKRSEVRPIPEFEEQSTHVVLPRLA